jgi:hypothetical protein
MLPSDHETAQQPHRQTRLSPVSCLSTPQSTAALRLTSGSECRVGSRGALGNGSWMILPGESGD